MIALACTDLIKRYEDVIAVNGLNLEVEVGECFGLLGPNGAGKTTTTEILEGLTAPDGGTVRLLDHAWGSLKDRRLREKIGVALQQTRLPEKLTVRETLRLFRSFYRQGRDESEIISLLGLKEKQNARVEKLSGGQQQRLALGCALVGTPEILFLDEPTTGLDPQARLAIWEIIERFRKDGGTVFLTTHYMEEAARLCNRVGIMDHGKLIALDTPDALIESLSAEQIIELNVGGVDVREALSNIETVSGLKQRGDNLILKVTKARRALPEILSVLSEKNAVVHSLTTRKATLEDVFVHLTGRALRDE